MGRTVLAAKGAITLNSKTIRTAWMIGTKALRARKPTGSSMKNSLTNPIVSASGCCPVLFVARVKVVQRSSAI